MKMNVSARIGRSLFIATLVFGLIGCASKKKAEDDAAAGGGTPTIDSTPMNFDAAGSDSGKIAGLETVHFEYDKASLSNDARKVIQGNANWMKSNPKSNIQIEGHCDARGSVEYNLSLGERRAKAVRDYMKSVGIPEARLSVISYGKEKLLANGDAESDHLKNRRANFLPLGQ